MKHFVSRKMLPPVSRWYFGRNSSCAWHVAHVSDLMPGISRYCAQDTRVPKLQCEPQECEATSSAAPCMRSIVHRYAEILDFEDLSVREFSRDAREIDCSDCPSHTFQADWLCSVVSVAVDFQRIQANENRRRCRVRPL